MLLNYSSFKKFELISLSKLAASVQTYTQKGHDKATQANGLEPQMAPSKYCVVFSV